MQRQDDVLQRDREWLCQQRRRAVDASGEQYPLFVYSYSSRGFLDIVERYTATAHLPPIHLVSLYDLHYHPLDSEGWADRNAAPAPRVLDSGTYEVNPTIEIGGLEGLPNLLPWSLDLYRAAARRYVRSGDILVGFDDWNLPVVEQIELAIHQFRALGTPNVRRDLLIHPGDVEPRELAYLVAPHASEFDILGLTEKDIGEPWFLAATFVRDLRAELDRLLDRYVPIHVFGCFDPKTIPYLFFAGADIFDGLAWMRYYFHDRSAYYAKEFEFAAGADLLLDRAEARNALLAHNIEELERLRADLQYAVLANDPSRFNEPIDALLSLEGARVSATAIRN